MATGGVIRVRQATRAVLSKQFYSGSTPADAGSVTVTVTGSDGQLVTSGAAGGAGTGPRTYTLQSADTAMLDTLSVVWVSTTLGSATSTVEVVGDFVFSTPELRAILTDETEYPDDRLQDARTYAETELERALGFALVPRYATRTLWARRADRIKLRPFVRVIRSATIGGTPISAANIANLIYSPDGYVAGYSWWNGQVVVRYEHGMDADNDLSSGASRAALSLAVEYLGGDASGNGVDPRAERLITDDGTIVYGAAAGGQFSVPDVNRWVTANGLPRTA